VTQGIKTYPYQPKKWIMLLGFVFFGLAAWLMVHQALTFDRGVNIVIIRHIIELPITPEYAPMFFWILAGLSVVLSLIGLYALICAFTSKAQIVISNDSISAPANIFRLNKIITIPYSEIISVKQQSVGSNRFLKIIHTKGKLSISNQQVPKNAMFDEIADLLFKQLKKTVQ
jgi:hypothetical protein